MTGKIKWFNNEKGYGFIEGQDDEDIFVHYSKIIGQTGYKTLTQGQLVTFNLIETEKGYQSTDVERVELEPNM